MNGLLLLAATPLDPPDTSEFWQRYFASKNETMLLLSSIGGVILVVLIWAMFIRKRKNEDARRYSYHGDSAGSSAPNSRDSASSPGRDEQESPGKRRKKRRRRRPHRPRNPTLSETGGLPPLRADSFTDDPP